MSIAEIDDEFMSEWIEFIPMTRSMATDRVAVAFSKNGRQATVRLGVDLMKQMRWTEKDKITVFVSKANKYKWALVSTTKGYKLGTESNAKNCKKFVMTWNQDGVTYTKSKECRHEINKEKLIVYVPM